MKWEHAVADYDLHGKEWATQMYERRRMWANAYLRDKFCAGFRTTSRCEGINAFVKKFSKTTHTIIELVQNLELVVREYQNKELLLHFNSMNSIPVMTTGLTSIEQHATSVYTREVFTDVKKQIVRAAALILISKKRCLNTMVYTDEEYKLPAMRIKVAFGRAFDNGRREMPIEVVGTKEGNCVVRDPTVAKPKGARKFTKKEHLRKMRLCIVCKRLGHTKRHYMKKTQQHRDCSDEEFVEHNGLHQMQQLLRRARQIHGQTTTSGKGPTQVERNIACAM
ncbi:hypothetical protein AHAS_Ahas12G0172900 [Arachis hypogaea]